MIPFEAASVAVAVLGTLAVIAVFVVRGHEIGWELSAGAMFTLYVRAAGLAATLVFAAGLAEILRAFLVTELLPPGYAPMRPSPPAEQIVRGATLAAAGAAFWGVHYLLPRPSVRGGALLYTAFVTVGAAAFGAATVATLPAAIAHEAQRLVGMQPPPRLEGALGGGIAAFLLWLGHLWQLRAQLGGGPGGRLEHTLAVEP
ncbi:MAG TPA: hypothetical protein VFM93_11310 [Candidatus Limnocylindria bacterium]|nr:hypothetical protein [Candidatus Limnocylindria bacterium]